MFISLVIDCFDKAAPKILSFASPFTLNFRISSIFVFSIKEGGGSYRLTVYDFSPFLDLLYSVCGFDPFVNSVSGLRLYAVSGNLPFSTAVCGFGYPKL